MLKSFILDFPQLLLLLRLPAESQRCYFTTAVTTTAALSLQSNCEHIYLTSVLRYVVASCFQFPVVPAASFINWRSHCRKITTLPLPVDRPKPSCCCFLLAGLSATKNIYHGYTNEKSRPVFSHSLFQTTPSHEPLVKANPTSHTMHLIYILPPSFLTNYPKYSAPNSFLRTHSTSSLPSTHP